MYLCEVEYTEQSGLVRNFNVNSYVGRHGSAIIMFMVAVISFFALDSVSISLGDDFGYMFTDAKLHGGGGHRVVSIADCWNTQLSHYMTTNGRFPVHLLTQIFLNVLPEWVYRVLNALVFGCLWLFMSRMVCGSSRPTVFKGILTWTSIWLLMPHPGLVMLSLVAFSINYMWTGAATVVFLWYFGRLLQNKSFATSHLCLLALFAILAGFMQESYSLPVSGALLIVMFILRKSLSKEAIIIGAAYMSGAFLCAIAPGNMGHLESEGGLATAKLLYKTISMSEALLLTPVPLCFVSIVVYAFIDRKACKAYMKDNALLLIAILLALAFAALSFTAVRQLYSVSFFAIIVLLRHPVWETSFISRHSFGIGLAAAVVTLSVLTGAFYLRQNNFRLYRQALESAAKNSALYGDTSYQIWTDVRLANYNRTPRLWHWLKRYAPDPWERSQFTFPFNNQVRRIMSRLYSKTGNQKSLSAMLPMAPSEIVRIWQTSPGNPVHIDSRYAVYAEPECKSEFSKIKVPSEGFIMSDTIYYVIPVDL